MDSQQRLGCRYMQCILTKQISNITYPTINKRSHNIPILLRRSASIDIKFQTSSRTMQDCVAGHTLPASYGLSGGFLQLYKKRINTSQFHAVGTFNLLNINKLNNK